MTSTRTNKEQPYTIPAPHISRKDRSIHINCPLEGIAEEKIRIDLEETLLIISIVNNGHTASKKVPVPAGSRISKKRFHDGVLEVVLERP